MTSAFVFNFVFSPPPFFLCVILCSVVCLFRGAGSLLAGCVCVSVCRHGGCYLGLASTVICTQQFQKIPLVPPATVAPANAVVNGNDTTFHQIHILPPPPPPPPPHSHQPLLPLFTSFGYNRSPVTTPQGDTPTAPGTRPLFILLILLIKFFLLFLLFLFLLQNFKGCFPLMFELSICQDKSKMYWSLYILIGVVSVGGIH